MGYRNAKDVLPPHLLEELQRYAEGESIYIPRRTPRPHSPAPFNVERDAAIRKRRAAGVSVRQLAEEYYLSPQAIYKILHRK